MDWLATPNDFANRVHVIIAREHPNVRLTKQDEQTYMWQDGTMGYAMLTVAPDERRVNVIFIKFPDLRVRADEFFPYTEASVAPVAQVIIEWITELKAP